ncbi:alpha-amylase [bacterium]|nr:alpha-amylase [Verrucomicrobiota bacterium]NBS54991.1 alpha-amylase [bacterium]
MVGFAAYGRWQAWLRRPPLGWLGGILSKWADSAEESFSKIPARPGPDWLAAAVVYEVFPRAFSKEGNLAGVTQRLAELKHLGADVIWLMPIHPTGEKDKPGPEGSPYAVRDYYNIDPRLGSKKDLIELVETAHGLGLKVILDLVPNHTAWDAVWMKDFDLYRKNSQGEVMYPQPAWKDVAALDYAQPKTRQAMIGVMRYWLHEAKVDGFRCDAACFVPLDFWEEARAALDSDHPSVLLLAEADDPPYLTKAFDLDYDWPLYHSLNRVMLEGKPVTDLRKTWEASRATFPQGSRHLSFSDNHDQVRAVARYGMDGAIAAQVLMFTLDGVPLVYNGMEVGDATESTAPALFENKKIEWKEVGRPPIRDLYRSLIAFRKQNKAMTSGEVVWLENSRNREVVSFVRKGEEQEILVVINFSSRPLEVVVRTGEKDAFGVVEFSDHLRKGLGTPARLQLPGFGWSIFKRKTATKGPEKQDSRA